VVAANTEAVPATSMQIPARVAPQARKLATVSPHPAATGVPGNNPHFGAMVPVISPTMRWESTICGIFSISTSNRRQSSASQRLFRLSANPEKWRYDLSMNASSPLNPQSRMIA